MAILWLRTLEQADPEVKKESLLFRKIITVEENCLKKKNEKRDSVFGRNFTVRQNQGHF